MEYRNPGLAAYLLEHAKAAVDAMTSGTAEIPLHWAVGRTRQPEMIALLLAHGADPTVVASYGLSSLDQARDADFRWAVTALQAARPRGEEVPAGDF